jgi:chromate transporter
MLLILFAEFFKIGLFSVGGGLATLPFLYRLADQYDWLDYQTITDMIAVAESTPGAIGVNMATYAGFQCAGIAGAGIATVGLVAPSIIIILIVARVLRAFKENAVVNAVFSGLRPAATGLIAAAGFGVIQMTLWTGQAAVWYEHFKWRECLLFAVIVALIYALKKHPVLYIGIAAVAGIVLGL